MAAFFVLELGVCLGTEWTSTHLIPKFTFVKHSGTKVNTVLQNHLWKFRYTQCLLLKGQNALVAGGLLAEGVTSTGQEKLILADGLIT